MASPQESVTTVNGRRCTRTRVRTAATSTPISTPAATPTAAAPTEPSSTIAEAVPTQQTAAGGPATEQPPPPPPPPPPPTPEVSSSPGEASAIVSLPTTQVAASSAAGTDNEVLISLATTPLPAVLQPSAPAQEDLNPSVPLQSSEQVIVPSQVAAAPTPPPASIAPTSSDTIETAAPPSSSPPAVPSSSPSPNVQPVVTESVGATNPTSVAAVPDIIQTASSQAPSSATTIAEILSQTRTAASGRPTSEPVGIIAPEQGSHSGGDAHSGDGHSSHSGSDSSHSGSDPKIGGIVGGVVGGFVALILLSLLLFFCLRRRKSREGGWNEKSEESSSFVSKLKAVPAGFGGVFARLRNEKTGPLDNPYQRHQPRASVGSVYSTTSSGRGRSISEGQAAVGGGFVRRMSSRKSERNVLRKKTSSVSSQSPFMGITEEPVSSTNNIGRDPFADSSPEPPRNLRISNPDTIEETARGPSPPQPAATPRVARDPFASLIDQIDGAPDWLRDSNWTASSVSNHRRTQSTASALLALHSHPPSSVYSRDPFADPTPAPPLPTQPLTTQLSQPQPQQSLNTYSTFPAARDSNYTFFGEPGPSRPGTNVFPSGLPSNPAANRPDTKLFNTAVMTPGPLTSGLPTSTSRLDRQSDPFDLDRPEVLSFKGIMNQMRDSIARTATVKSRRTSSVGNWFGRDASPAAGARR